MARTLPGHETGTSRPKLHLHRSFPAWTAIAALAASLLSPQATAQTLDPSVPQRFVTTLPAGAAITERLTATSTNQTSLPFPEHAQIGWQVRLAPPIFHAPLALAGERLLVSHGRGRLSELDRNGRTLWSLRTGAELVGSPIVLGGGERLAITREADILRIGATGRELSRERMPVGDVEVPPLSVPTADGGALLGIGARLVRLGPRGAFLWSTATPDPVRALFEWRGSALAVGRNGSVHVRPPAGALREIASLEVTVRSALLVDQRLWLLAAGENQLIELDLATARHATRFSDSALEFSELASAPGTSLRALTRRGILLGVDAAGREISRSALLPDAVTGDAAALIVDQRGAALAAFSGAGLVFVTPQGDASPLPGTACPDPLRPTPLAPGLVIAACRSGLLRALSDKAR